MTSSSSVCVIGVGYVGEHLVDVFSKVHNVIGYDVSPYRVELMQKYFADKPNVTIQSTLDGLDNCDLFCISVPTLLNAEKNGIDTSYIESAAKTIDKVAKKGSIVVIESSVAVGMTRTIMGHFRKERDLYIGFSPERVDPGRTDPPADKIPKIISGMDNESLEKIKEFYESVFDHVVPVSSMETAEMCKLYENCFRMINVAYVNEIADNCGSHGIDVYEMVRACSTKPFGFMPFYPGLGVGGHCIPVNPFYLFTNNKLPLLKSATDVTLKRPEEKANQIEEENVLVVGLAFKPGESYTMNSPGLDIANALVTNGKNVTVYDPLVDPETKPVKHHKFLDNEDWNSEYIINNFDAVVVAIKQRDIDFTVLGKVTCKVYKYCEL